MPAASTQLPFAETSRLGLSRAAVTSALDRHQRINTPKLSMLWAYYRNPMESCVPIARSGGTTGRGFRLAQEQGLPSRIRGNWSERGPAAALADDREWSRKEVVIENDIAWRVHTMVDFMFGRPVALSSTARDPHTRRAIDRVLDAVIESSGGAAFLHDLGLLGHIYGHVDVIVRPVSPSNPSGPGDAQAGEGDTPRDSVIDDHLLSAARNSVRLELVDPIRAVALPASASGHQTSAYILRSTRPAPPTDAAPASAVAGAFASTLRRWWNPDSARITDNNPSNLITTTEVFAGGTRQVFEQTPDGETRLIHESASLIEPREGDSPPIVHIQNISQPFAYTGLSEVEPLIPLQDELNTRLSDRASRVTLMSFKMFLAKGIDGAEKLPIGPGIIWSTDNEHAQIHAFGGDAAAPSEDAHIEQIREALDKASGVPPLASGVVRAKIGNLSSENALKITLMGLLSKTARKRVAYGRGLAELSRLILDALDRLNILKTDPADRTVRVDWTDPLPRDERQALEAAKAKVDLGIPRDRVLSELGYGTTDQGVV